MTEMHTYPCSVCKTDFKWADPEPKHGKTCPNCRSQMMDEIIAWGDAQDKDEQKLHERMNNWWDSLPKDVQEKAFFCVVKKIVNAELVNQKTYRQILHEDFGFDKDAYYMGITCGFLKLHNNIYTQKEMRQLRDRELAFNSIKVTTEKVEIKNEQHLGDE